MYPEERQMITSGSSDEPSSESPADQNIKISATDMKDSLLPLDTSNAATKAGIEIKDEKQDTVEEPIIKKTEEPLISDCLMTAWKNQGTCSQTCASVSRDPNYITPKGEQIIFRKIKIPQDKK